MEPPEWVGDTAGPLHTFWSATEQLWVANRPSFLSYCCCHTRQRRSERSACFASLVLVPLGCTQEMMERTVRISKQACSTITEQLNSSSSLSNLFTHLPAKAKVAMTMKPKMSARDNSSVPVIVPVFVHDWVIFICFVWCSRSDEWLGWDGRLKEMRSRIYCGGISLCSWIQFPLHPSSSDALPVRRILEITFAVLLVLHRLALAQPNKRLQNWLVRL